MIKLSRILKDYRESGAVNRLVGVLEAVDDRVFLTKSGDLLVMLATPGIDYECRDAVQLEQITHRFESAVRMFDENFRFYQYLLKRDNPPIPHRAYEDPVVRAAVENRTAYLQAKASHLYSLDIYYALVYEWTSQHKRAPERLSHSLRNLRDVLSTRSQIAILDEELNRAREVLNNKVTSFIVQLQDTLRVDVSRQATRFQLLPALTQLHALQGRYGPFEIRPVCGLSGL